MRIAQNSTNKLIIQPMKNILTVLLIVLSLTVGNAQHPELWGMTSQGGIQDYGVVFKINGDGSGYWKIHDFMVKNSGSSPENMTLLLYQGWLYGVAKYGGYGNGVLFKYHPGDNKYVALHYFSGIEGSLPSGSLLLASNGKMYGVASNGGTNNYGTLFEFDALTEQLQVKYHFIYATGIYPNGKMVEKDGYLYGVLGNSLSANDGGLYRYHLATESMELLHTFQETDGEKPLCDLLLASDGKFYGRTLKGGNFDNGVIFCYDPSVNSTAIVHHFTGSMDGFYSTGNLIELVNGKLIGTNYNGGQYSSGTLFEYNLTDHSYNTIYHFGTDPSFRNPGPFLRLHTDGWVYGTNGSVTPSVFRFYPDSMLPHQVSLFVPGNFNISNPYPVGGFTDYGDGWFYSTTSSGGVSLCGTIFRFNPESLQLEKLIDLNETISIHPFGSLCLAQNGKFYSVGGFGMGTYFNPLEDVFSYAHPQPGYHQYSIVEIDPYTGNFKRLAPNEPVNFGEVGINSLTPASNGQVYGLTAHNGGKVFRYDPASDSTETFLEIDNNYIGDVKGDLMQAANGKLYGLSTTGGVQSGNSAGIIFKIDPQEKTFKNVFDFEEGVSGNSPQGSLLQATDGMLYGMTKSLGMGSDVKGTIFRYSIGSDTFEKLYEFQDTLNGKYPLGNLIEGTDGLLYGMTSKGGASGCGVIFRFNQNDKQFNKLWDFNGELGGGYPQGSLLLASDSIMYGMTLRGGLNDKGVIFSFNPTTLVYEVIEHFNLNEKGALPYGNLVEYHGPPSVIYCTPDTVACLGSDITLLVIATGGYLHHTWYHNGNEKGHTKEYKINTADIMDSGKYWCVIYNDVDTVVSDTIHLQVIDSVSVSLSIAGPNELCPYDDPVELSGMPAGGTYSGAVVNGNYFNPALYQAGDYAVYYIYNYGCQIIDTVYLTVNELPQVEFVLPEYVFLCDYEAPIVLEALPPGGNFSGNGVTGSTFDPAVAGIGTHNILYTITEDCSISSSFTITVEDCLETPTQIIHSPVFMASPNPFSELLKVSLPGEMLDGNSHFRLINQIGHTVAEDKIVARVFFIKRGILASGIYLLIIESNTKLISKVVVVE